MTFLAAAALAVGGGAAAKPGNSKGPGAKSGDHQERSAPDIDISISLGEAHRSIVRDHYRANCPPGLAKKNNGCLPPLPRGYGYRMVDGDLVVVALATLIIADAIGLF